MAKKSTVILGLSFFYHDAAAAVIIDGVVVAAAQEERFTRVKHDENFPRNAINRCLELARCTLADVDYVVFYEKPLLKFERLLLTYIRTWPKGVRSFLAAIQSFLKDKLWVEKKIRKELDYSGKILFTEHHYAHGASAYYCSEFNDSLVVTMDGVGEWDTATIGVGRGNELRLLKTLDFPDSLGMLYSALTYYLGFKVNSAEYKVMGLAPYGDATKYLPQMRELISIAADGSFCLNKKYFAYEYGFTMTNKAFDKLFGGPPRSAESGVGQREKDIAAALQKITEEVVLKIVRYGQSIAPSRNLCLAGGVALNCVANGKILEEKLFDHIYVQPAAGDAGGAVGAALYVYFEALKKPRPGRVMPTAFVGTQYTRDEIKHFLDTGVRDIVGADAHVNYGEFSDKELIPAVAQLIVGTNVIGWFQGKMEFGPRALGNRSIIADPRNKDNWQKVNLKIKFRESFRPFAPTVLEERTSDYFTLNEPSPYMLLVAGVKNEQIPAVTHVDGSARIQTINREQNSRYYDLIKAFADLSGCPVIINTSFNVRGEPIVESPRDAFNCFINTYMDYLVLGNFVISKAENNHLINHERLKNYLGSFALD